ncbi:hypothetical protein CDD83_3882 [Cordyceps sp. RAO-2017]|nr:hypothetical protein CDD83_3882 [Cordyceps sp. RAO-2017]
MLFLVSGMVLADIRRGETHLQGERHSRPEYPESEPSGTRAWGPSVESEISGRVRGQSTAVPSVPGVRMMMELRPGHDEEDAPAVRLIRLPPAAKRRAANIWCVVVGPAAPSVDACI